MRPWTRVIAVCVLALALQGCEAAIELGAQAVGNAITNSLGADRSDAVEAYTKYCLPEPYTERFTTWCSEQVKLRATPTAPAPSASTEGTATAAP